MQIVLKSQNKLAKAFRFKDCIPKELTSSVVYKFQCGICNEFYYGKCVRHLNDTERHCMASATDVKLTLLLCLKIFTVSECQNTIIQIHKDEYFNAKLVL